MAVVGRIFFQPILDVACMEAKTVTKGRLNNDKANRKGKVRLECAAAVRGGRLSLMFALTRGGMNNKRVGGSL